MQELIKAWTSTRKQIVELTVVKQSEQSEGVFTGESRQKLDCGETSEGRLPVAPQHIIHQSNCGGKQGVLLTASLTQFTSRSCQNLAFINHLMNGNGHKRFSASVECAHHLEYAAIYWPNTGQPRKSEHATGIIMIKMNKQAI